MEFRKVVRLVGSNHWMLQYPLTSGEDRFSAGVDYAITNRKDFSRLMQSGLFVDATPAPAVAPVIKEDVVLEEEVPAPKDKSKRNKEEVNN